MIISQLMLAGFVSYWLKSQYDDEKDLLGEAVSRIYDESRNQVIDSLLFNRVVEPALNDSLDITVMTRAKIDTTNHKVMKVFKNEAFFARNDSCQSALVTIGLSDSAPGEGGALGTTFSNSGKKQDMLIRSVRLFINHSGDSVTNTGSFSGFLPGNPDTALFKKVFKERIAQKKFRVSIIWTEDTAKATKPSSSFIFDTNQPKPAKLVSGVNLLSPLKDSWNYGKQGMHFSSTFPDNLPGVQVKGEFPYLIGRLGAQILFALILLLLTGSAFFFTNRSFKRQLILNGLRNDFVSNITHELRTPVSTVKVALEALKTFDKAKNPVIMREYLDMAAQEMNRLDQLISKVLDQSLIGDQKQIIQPRPSDINQLINNILLSLQPRFDSLMASVKFDSSEIPGLVMVDPLHFQGILINLIDNSLKYGPENPEILIRLWQEDGTTCIEVSDHGPGIPKEYLSRVFDKFFRVPTGDIHNIKGYGLGLSFAAMVMKQHQGSISVKNLDQGGCAFTLRFPSKTA
jgi:signal transduction histidine kinase